MLGTPDADGNAPVAKAFVYGNYIDEVIQIRDHTQPAPEDFYAHQDDLFSVYAITDAVGAVTQRYLNGDYGTRVTTDPGRHGWLRARARGRPRLYGAAAR